MTDKDCNFFDPTKCPFWELNVPAAINLKIMAHCVKSLQRCKYDNSPEEFNKIDNDIRNCDIYKRFIKD